MTYEKNDKFGKILYIKLGPGGCWEDECLKEGVIRFGYHETPFASALSGDWNAVHSVWLDKRNNRGAATRDVEQIKAFFESDESTLWITFHNRSLWWCHAESAVWQHESEGSYRKTLSGWSNRDKNGEKLSFDKLSGKLLRTQGFRGTICEIKEIESEYLRRKLDGNSLPEVEAAKRATDVLLQAAIPLIESLSWQDFELFVDLIYSQSGWRRISSLGETQKDIDMELLLPTTGERASLQIKTAAEQRDLDGFFLSQKQTDGISRMFFVFHSGSIQRPESAGSELTIAGPNELAKMALDAGLITWLLNKTS